MKKHIFMFKMFYEVSPFQTLLILGQALLGVATVFAGLKMSESIVAMVMSGNSLPTILKICRNYCWGSISTFTSRIFCTIKNYRINC